MISHRVAAQTRSSAVVSAHDQIILGSASPRRSSLLTTLGVSFTVATADIDEAALIDPDAEPRAVVARIAAAKFAAFRLDTPTSVLITADTLVACEGALLGKPTTASHLTAMLEQMSGRVLEIITAVCVGSAGSPPAVEIVTTTVRLRPVGPEEIAAYVETDAGFDKAGGLALQAEAAHFIDDIDGCWSNVMGLPICAVSALLDREPSGAPQSARCLQRHCGGLR